MQDKKLSNKSIDRLCMIYTLSEYKTDIYYNFIDNSNANKAIGCMVCGTWHSDTNVLVYFSTPWLQDHTSFCMLYNSTRSPEHAEYYVVSCTAGRRITPKKQTFGKALEAFISFVLRSCISTKNQFRLFIQELHARGCINPLRKYQPCVYFFSPSDSGLHSGALILISICSVFSKVSPRFETILFHIAPSYSPKGGLRLQVFRRLNKATISAVVSDDGVQDILYRVGFLDSPRCILFGVVRGHLFVFRFQSFVRVSGLLASGLVSPLIYILQQRKKAGCGTVRQLSFHPDGTSSFKTFSGEVASMLRGRIEFF